MSELEDLKQQYDRLLERYKEQSKKLTEAQAWDKQTQLMKCGHHVSCLESDQCGRPEHRYCSYCNLIRMYDEERETFDFHLRRRVEAEAKLAEIARLRCTGGDADGTCASCLARKFCEERGIKIP